MSLKRLVADLALDKMITAGKKDLKQVKKGLAAEIWYTLKFAIDKARLLKSYCIHAGKSPQIETCCLLGVTSRKISFKESFVLEDIKV